MKATNAHPFKKTGKENREYNVLIRLIELYLKNGKPIGSNTLKENGFEDLSSATIRNYFGDLEKLGFLEQQHSSGGRIPTQNALRLFAKEHLKNEEVSSEIEKEIAPFREREQKEITLFLHESAGKLSSLTKTAIFLSSPRFDQDFIHDVKIVPLDRERCLAITISDFGMVQTEVLPISHRLSEQGAKRIEGYFNWRLKGREIKEPLTEEEEKIATYLYHEVTLRYVAGSSHFTDEDLFRFGFSHLLHYPEMSPAKSLAGALALFENTRGIRQLLREAMKKRETQLWIGTDLLPHCNESPECSVITAPFYVNHSPVGAIGVLGPLRLPYPEIFAIVHSFAGAISTALTKSIYRFQIRFRQPQEIALQLEHQERILLEAKDNLS